jgi:hypothetical protein
MGKYNHNNNKIHKKNSITRSLQRMNGGMRSADKPLNKRV